MYTHLAIMTRILALSAILALMGCVSDFDACGGNSACMNHRQTLREQLWLIEAQNPHPYPIVIPQVPFYPVTTHFDTPGPVRLQTTCSRVGSYTYCN